MMKQVKSKIPVRMLTLLLGLILSISAFAQSTVNGHVKDATGEPVIGASILINGTTDGTVTDLDGNFVLNVQPGATLTISYIGYQKQQVTAVNGMVVTLQEDAAQQLNEVVVIGYGAVKKSDLTGSVLAMKPDGKNKGVIVNPQDMLAGKAAGVSVISNDGTPGGGAQIRIRGGASLNASNDPLIVIDGLAIDNNGVKGVSNILSTINPQDIESFNVLKDASATAIYGSRGSNGVIIITTKKGRRGLNISYAGSVTMSMKKKTIDVMDGNQYRDFIKNIFGENSDQYRMLGTANTNWQDEIYRTAWSHDHNVTVSGSTQLGEANSLPYRVSVGYTDQQGILKTSDFKRYTAAVNLSPSFFNDHLNMNLNAKGMYAKSQFADGGAIGAAVWMDPTQAINAFTSPYHTAMPGIDQALSNFGGYFQWPTDGSALNDNMWKYTKFNEATANPLSLLNLMDDHANSRQFIGSADFDYKVHGFEDLRLHLTLGADIAKGKQTTNKLPAYPGSIYYGSYGSEEIFKRNLSLSAYAQYFKDFNEKHHFDIMAGYEYQSFYQNKNNDYVGYYASTNNDASLAGTARPHTPYYFATDHYLVSFFGRANYTLMDRYMITATVRDDGSSRFKNHWAIFPSFAFAWKIKDENKFRDIKWLSDLKLRLGWGMTGQQEGDVADYGWVATYEKSTGTNGYYPLIDMNGDGKITAEDGILYRPANRTPDLKWETTTTYNVGLDFGLWNQRLSGTVDWYFRKTTDLLNYAPYAAMGLFKNQAWQNIGSMNNTGVEVQLDWKAVQAKDFYWTIGYNFTYNYNKITDLSGVTTGGMPVQTGDDAGGMFNKVLAHQVGYAANSFYVYQQVYDKNGKPIENQVVDRNGDGQINSADRYIYKTAAPPVTMGLTSRMDYKNFDFGFTLRASIGNYVFNNIESTSANMSPGSIYAQNAYLANRPIMSLEKNWQTNENTAQQSDLYVHNASFLKVDNITLGYSFTDLFKSDSWKGIGGRIYATAANVFTFTKYNGIDPETKNGIDNNLYPRPFSVILGLNLNF